MAFAIDSKHHIVNNACYLLTGHDLNYLLLFLNSKAIKWYSNITNMNQTGVGDVQVGKQNINIIPIPLLKDISNHLKTNLNTINTNFNTDIVDKFIYSVYKFTQEEIEFIDSQ